MGSRLAGSLRRRAAAASVVAALLWCSVSSAQTDAGASTAPAEPDPQPAVPAEDDPSAALPSAEPAPTEPAPTELGASEAPPREPVPSEPPPGGPPASGPLPSGTGAAPANSPKALTPQQRLPENLQGWLRERNRKRPVVAERPPLAPPPGLASPASEANAPERNVDAYKRRLQSFDEGGVTVLSNRHALTRPLARVQEAAAIEVPAPVAVVTEPEWEEPPLTETHSLRTNQLRPRRVPSEQGLSWPVFAVPVAAISLALLWLRKRRTSG